MLPDEKSQEAREIKGRGAKYQIKNQSHLNNTPSHSLSASFEKDCHNYFDFELPLDKLIIDLLAMLVKKLQQN